MKKLVLIMLLFHQIASSQNITISKIDEFTKKEIVQVNASEGKNWKGSDNIAKGIFNYMFLSLQKSDSVTYMNIDLNVGAMICINNDSKIIILFEDNTTLELTQIAKIDCAQRVVCKYFLNNENIDKLSNNLFKKARIYTTDGYLDFEIKENKKELIKNTFTLFKSKT